MNADQLKSRIKELFPNGLNHRKHGSIDLDEDIQARRILAHYAAKPNLKGRSVQLAINDLMGLNSHA